MKNGQPLLIALLLFTAISACAAPAPAIQSTPLAAPTLDTSRIASMVAETVSALMAQTEQAQPTFTATPIFTTTNTPTATATTAPSQTPTLAASLVQSALTQQEDGSTLFVDERAGYEISLPEGWLAVRANEKEYLDAFSREESANEHIQQALLGVQNENPNIFRLLAIDTQPAHIKNEFVSDIRFDLNETKSISLTSDADLQTIAQEISATATTFRFEPDSIMIITAISGMKFGVIEAHAAFENTDGVEVPLYQKRVFFNAKNGTQSIVLTTLDELKESVLPAFDAMLENIKTTP